MKIEVLCASRESAVETDGERLTIRHISTVSVEFAAEKYSERVIKARPAKPLEQEKTLKIIL